MNVTVMYKSVFPSGYEMKLKFHMSDCYKLSYEYKISFHYKIGLTNIANLNFSMVKLYIIVSQLVFFLSLKILLIYFY